MMKCAHYKACLFLLCILPLVCSAWQPWSGKAVPYYVEATGQSPFAAAVSRILSSLSGWSTKEQKYTAPKQLRLTSIYHQGTHKHRGLSARYDVPETRARLSSADANDDEISGIIRTKRVKTFKPRNITPFLQAHSAGDLHGVRAASLATQWYETDVEAPDVTDRETLLTFAKMASKAYDAPKNVSDKDWIVDEGGKWKLSESFGWVEDGIRGHIFATKDNSTIVVSLKGTSAALLDDGSTSKRDKENDNLLFSCCCARVGITWHTVCDCYNDGLSQQTCSSSCLTKALIEKSFFYPATTDLFNNISYAYPESTIWITGHSLGGALGALIGMTFGYPTVTFEAPAERMAALRLHLPLPTKHKGTVDQLPITHVYHTADPIPMGECIGAASICANFGFAMESRCHSGQTILYDTVGKLGWASRTLTHGIKSVIESVLDEDWDKKVAKASRKGKVLLDANADKDAHHTRTSSSKWHLPWMRNGYDDDKDDEHVEKLGPVPKLRSEQSCVDCSDWKFTDD